MEERVIDGVLHRLEGKTFVPMTAEELTARLLEARKLLAERPLPGPLVTPPSAPWVYTPFLPPYTVGDVIPNPIEITCIASATHGMSGTVTQ